MSTVAPASSPVDFPSTSRSDITKKHGDRLPHWTADGAVYHVVFRLADSLPAKVMAQFEEESRYLKAQPNLSREDRKRLEHLVSRKVESYLDSGAGECLMREPDIAGLVAKALAHFEGDRYHLHAWCVMPNHVHLIIEPLPGHELPKILHSLKSYTAHQIAKKLNRSGAVWQPEYFDHLIRSGDSFERSVEYVLSNPAKAGLQNWRWVGSYRQAVAPASPPVSPENRRDGGTTVAPASPPVSPEDRRDGGSAVAPASSPVSPDHRRDGGAIGGTR